MKKLSLNFKNNLNLIAKRRSKDLVRFFPLDFRSFDLRLASNNLK